MNRWSSVLPVVLLFLVVFANLSEVHAQLPPGHQDAPTDTSVANDPHQGNASGRWEGSPEGTDFS